MFVSGLFILASEIGEKEQEIIFFSARERARWTKSCYLIGSGSGRNFPILTAVNGTGRGELATCIEIWENKGVSFSYIASCDFWVLTE